MPALKTTYALKAPPDKDVSTTIAVSTQIWTPRTLMSAQECWKPFQYMWWKLPWVYTVLAFPLVVQAL
jgi:hypothetical protein